MGGIRFCGCGYQSENPLTVLGQNHSKDLCARSPTRPEENEGRKVPEKREGGSQQKGAEEDSRQERAVKRRSVKGRESGREETSQQKSERRLLGPVDPQVPGWLTQEDESAFVVACGNFARIHAPDSLQMHGELHKSVTDFPLLRLELTQARHCWFFFFFHPLSCIFVLVKKCEIPLAGDEKNH